MDRRQFFRQVGLLSLTGAATASLAGADVPRGGEAGAAKVKWQKTLKSAHQAATQQNKPIMIVFGAAWCNYCHKLEKETLTEKKTVALIEREFVPIHLDYDKDEKVAKILEVDRLPCVVILTPDADLLSKTEGFADAKEFQAILISALEKRAEIQQVRDAGNRN